MHIASTTMGGDDDRDMAYCTDSVGNHLPLLLGPIEMERHKVKGQLHRSYLKLCPSAVAKAATMVPFEQSDLDVTKGCEKSAARDQLISSFNGGSEP
ncbi:uncharacterized protein LOC109724675 isoform X8 [Ananas comosus]|uniref:Uncharacterized protein LOC109724675 isoform X8 n=1 Tax=Ananas comosus TaxID=4615 RepID=A0A6P5GUI5_ANACO|nr:uncharacterized protein LOC109724675 isoform X8 [Ananas comosus]